MNPQPKPTISKTETIEFTNWCFTERHKFSGFLLDSLKWFDMPPEQIVKIENFLICFDQLLDRQSQQAAFANADTGPQHSYSEQEQWVSVKDSDNDILPPFEVKQLIVLEDGTMHTGYFNGADNYGYVWFCDNNDYHYPTHCKKLPAPPKQ